MVAEHLTVPHRFVCLSDVEIEGIETIKLLHGWRGWWSKIELFRPGLFDGERVLFFDLDTFINQNIDRLFFVAGRFIMLRDFGAKDVPASGVMRWEGDYSEIYHDFLRRGADVMQNYTVRGCVGDQAFIAKIMKHPSFWQDLTPEGFFKSFKKGGRGEDLKETPVVCFHGEPKPWDGGGWIQRFWESKL